ncbi:hypothetical protein [Pseudomonas sp. UV AK001]|uniref:hypothetical protein n=1 Tax=Pseudomonas sp. UV AK001 TaxID=3384791 RepID=UPI0038D405A3
MLNKDNRLNKPSADTKPHARNVWTCTGEITNTITKKTYPLETDFVARDYGMQYGITIAGRDPEIPGMSSALRILFNESQPPSATYPIGREGMYVEYGREYHESYYSAADGELKLINLADKKWLEGDLTMNTNENSGDQYTIKAKFTLQQ